MMSMTHFGADHYPVISAGVDWLTATANTIDGCVEYLDILNEMRTLALEEHELINQETRQGFEGFSLPHFFWGKREHEAMIQVSSGLAHLLTARVAGASSNISRLDLQVTVDTQSDLPDLATHGYNTLKRVRDVTQRQGSYQLTVAQPRGAMLTVNKRVGDEYGRLYDKASESKLGPPHSLYRYEVELKRKRASFATQYLLQHDLAQHDISNLVWNWFAVRGLEPFYPYTELTEASAPVFPRVDRNVLAWFETSVSVTVARSVKRHGLTATLDALGLSPLVQPR